MTALLTAGAVVGTFMLLFSATSSGARATASDPHKRGPWGMVNWSSDRNRPLTPHQRRWQTALLSSRDNAAKWADLAADIQKLERLSNVTSVGPVPDKLDNAWIDASISNLEKATATHAATTAGESTQ